MPLPYETRRRPSMLGLALSVGGALSIVTALALTALVLWLDLSRDEVPYIGMTVRIVVIGGFFAALGFMMWKVGGSLKAAPHRIARDED
ncbi:MAG TPA: hypothetical protein VLL76_06420 [Candidatus Omnitrophota bacterium]|nr:hypothetical protein [Candidatus Omnitrophota bacterium]